MADRPYLETGRQFLTPGFITSQFNLVLLGSLVISRDRHPLSYTRAQSRLRSCHLLAPIFLGREDEADYLSCCDEIDKVISEIESRELYGDILFSLLDLVWNSDMPTLVIRLENEDVSYVAVEWARLVQLVVPTVSLPDLVTIVLSLFRVSVEYEKMLGIATRPDVDPEVLRLIQGYPDEAFLALSSSMADIPDVRMGDPLSGIRARLAMQ